MPRLRIYPHALRTDNAYYSPDKKALLFGYFPSESTDSDTTTTPGSTVFSCLSSDIVAHEMSHALLDGLHRRFQEASNPDVPAFHEAFADIVALFQHFTLKELVSFEIARARGDLSAANLLSGLAKQFGEGSGRGGPLRDYGPKMAELDYDTTTEPHDRGSILVFAVYEAFLAIVARRTDDLIQLATGGTGVLPAGALHPGLVERLAEETSKTAAQMLTMCIRALDYCPAVDITFGEYLRALITADIDAFPADPRHYRLAFMESFRKWKLLPRDVRTVSEETLAWSTLDDPSPDWLHGLLDEHRSRLEPEAQPLRGLCAQREEPLGAVERHGARLRGAIAISTGSSACCPTCRATTATARCSGRPARASRPSTSSACGRPGASSPTARSAPK